MDRGMAAALTALVALPGHLRAAGRKAMAQATTEIHHDLVTRSLTAKRKESSLFRGGGQGGLAVDKGRLRASVTSRVFESGGVVVGVVGTPVTWAPIHETGGTIQGKPWLRIPTVFASRYPLLVRANAGKPVRGHGGRFRKASGFALRSIPRTAEKAGNALRTFFKKTRGGSLFLFVRDGNKAVPVYLLKKSVTMPARRPFGQTADRVRPRVIQLFDKAVELVVRGGA